MEKLWQIVRHAEESLSTHSFMSRRNLAKSLERLDARQRYYIRETLERARSVDRTMLVHLVTLKHLVNHWDDQDMATKVAVLWCIDALAGTEFARAVLHGSPYVSEILSEIREQAGNDVAAQGHDAAPREGACTSTASHCS